MHYSPIIAPILALFLISQIATTTIAMTGIWPLLSQRPQPSRDDFVARIQELLAVSQNTQLLGFYVIALSLALMRTDEKIMCWLAWFFVGAWTATKFAAARNYKEWRYRFGTIAFVIQLTMALGGGWRIIQSGSLNA